jgi:hypothetical protein
LPSKKTFHPERVLGGLKAPKAHDGYRLEIKKVNKKRDFKNAQFIEKENII